MASHHVCPWWLGYLLASRVRRLWQDPAPILGPFVREGMIVLEPGPGMGFFTLELARLVGSKGRVYAVDVQRRMLAGLARRAGKAGLEGRIECRLATSESMGLDDLAGRVDFVLAFAMVHEVPDAASLFRQLHVLLKPGGRVLVSEPRGHVSDAKFARMLDIAREAGFRATDADAPTIRRSLTTVLERV